MIPHIISIIRIVAIYHAGRLEKTVVVSFIADSQFHGFSAFGATPFEMGPSFVGVKPDVGITPDEVNPDELLA